LIIDGHAHAAGDYATPEAISLTASRFDIGKIVLCTSPKNHQDLGTPPDIPFMKSPSSIYFLNNMVRLGYRSLKDNGDGNRYVHGLATAHPRLVVQFLWLNPLDQEHMEALEHNIHAYNVRGLKLHQAWDSFAIDSEPFLRVTEVARAHRLPIFIHLHSKRETAKLAKFAVHAKDSVFIIAHMLGLEIFAEYAEVLDNLYFDTSGSARVRKQDILEAINTFGHDHVVFGSDTPYASLADQIPKIQQLGVSPNVLDHIFVKNMAALLGNAV
jgi:predicted TIM-barrel fold metal-dependent hydrolase